MKLPSCHKSACISRSKISTCDSRNLRAGVANCLRHLGRTEEALSYYRRALDAGQGSFGPSHPLILDAQAGETSCLRCLRRFDEALPIARSVLAAREEALGPARPAVLESLVELASVLGEMGRPEEALPLFERASDACKPPRCVDCLHLWLLSGGGGLACLCGRARQTAVASMVNIATVIHSVSIRDACLQAVRRA